MFGEPHIAIVLKWWWYMEWAMKYVVYCSLR